MPQAHNLTVERSTVKIRDEVTHDNKPARTYSVNELADEAGVTRRTVHYYVAQGLLPPAGTEGPGTRYGEGHLDRLRLIRELQREHLPLSEIRSRLERLNDEQVRDLLNAGESLPEPRGTAFDYIQSVLAGTNRRALSVAMPARAPAARQAPAAAATPPAPPAGAPPPPFPAPVAAAPALPSAASPPEPSNAARSQWERISLGPDVELHVRRPQSRLQNRAVDRLVALARQLLEEDPQ